MPRRLCARRFRKKGIDAHVTLLTGDVKIRAPPGSEKELIICTSEILRNKLVKAAGTQPAAVHFAAAKAAADAGDSEAATALAALIRDGFTGDGDPDLERLGCVVSDEIHYINDVDRGAVWEAPLLHMPAAAAPARAAASTAPASSSAGGRAS